MTRPFVFALLCAFCSWGCRDRDAIRVVPPRPELVEIGLPEPGARLLYVLPDDGWRRIEEAPFKGFLYGKEGRTLRVVIVLKEDRLDALAEEARAAAAATDEVRTFGVGRAWPFVGVVLTYRGPPDAPMLDDFVRSFKTERR